MATFGLSSKSKYLEHFLHLFILYCVWLEQCSAFCGRSLKGWACRRQL